jgi:hypothetical protein
MRRLISSIQLTILPINNRIPLNFQQILQPLLHNPNPLIPHPLQNPPSIPHPLPNPPQLVLTRHHFPRPRSKSMHPSNHAGTFEIPYCGQIGICGGVWGWRACGVSAVEGGWVCYEYGYTACDDILWGLELRVLW